MSSNRYGRENVRAVRITQAPAVEPDIEPFFRLLTAIVERAQLDLNLPVDHRGYKDSRWVTPHDQASARQFLEELRESATRRVVSE